MKYDASLTESLRAKLDGLDLSGFVAPTEPEIRTATNIRDILRPSNMHRCERALTLTIRALPFTSTTSVEALTAMNFGTHVHRKIQAYLGLPAEIQVKGPWLKGSKDLQWEPKHGVDLKTINRKGFLAVKKAGAATEDHWLQQSWYSWHDGDDKASVVYIGKPANGSLPEKIDGEALLAFTGSPRNGDDTHPYDAKLERIRAHHKAGTLPPHEAVRECYWCPVKAECYRRMPIEREQRSKIVGHYAAGDPDRLAAFLSLQVGSPLRLEWEPENAFGPRLSDDETKAAAVKVLDESGRQCGYLPASDSPTADMVARHIRNGGRVEASVIECTGETNGRENAGRNIVILASA